MNPIMVSANFDVRELVHPDIYNMPHIGNRSADFLHPNLPVTLEAIRANLIEVITVNNWHRGGDRINSGLRSFHKPLGKSASYSAHYFGTAADTVYANHLAPEVFAHILENQDRYPFITRMEAIAHTPSWVHIEVGAKRSGNIVVFNP